MGVDNNRVQVGSRSDRGGWEVGLGTAQMGFRPFESIKLLPFFLILFTKCFSGQWTTTGQQQRMYRWDC